MYVYARFTHPPTHFDENKSIGLVTVAACQSCATGANLARPLAFPFGQSFVGLATNGAFPMKVIVLRGLAISTGKLGGERALLS